MEKKYVIRRTASAPGLDDAVWETAEKQSLDNFFCPESDNPTVTVQALCSEDGITVRFEADEKNPTTNYWTANQPAWLDSCVEFFFAPDMSDPLNYLNFEQSLGGALLIQKGTQDDRRYIPHTDEPFKIQKHIDDNGGKSNFSYPFHSFPCITANSTQTLKETSSSATKTKTYTLPGTKLNRRSLHSIVRNSSQTFKCAYSTS